MIVTFESVLDDQTKLTIEYPRPASDAAFEAMKKSRMEDGWNSSFDKLQKTLNESQTMCENVCETK